MTPLNTHWSQVRAGNLLVWGADPEPPKAAGNLTWTGWEIHFPLYAARPDIVCALHVHPPYATALASLKEVRLEPATQTAMGMQKRIAYADEWSGRADGEELRGASLAEALGDRDILILKHHGVLVVGPSVGIAFTNLYMLERACRVQVLAMSTGRELDIVAELPERSRPAEEWKNQSFAAMRAVLDQAGADYRD